MSAESEKVRLISREIIFSRIPTYMTTMYFNVTDGQTDGQTDGRTNNLP